MFDIIKNMSFKGKIEYIWEYYKFHIIGVFVLIYTISSLLNHFIINPPPSSFVTIGFVGEHIEEITLINIGEEINNNLISDDLNKVAQIENFFKSDNVQLDTALSTRFFALLSNKDIDIVITDMANGKEFIQEGATYPLTNFFTQDELNLLSSDFIYNENEEVVAFTIKDSNILKQNDFDINGKIFLILSDKNDSKVIKDTVNFLFLN